MIFDFKLATIALMATLNWIGGSFWHNARRYIMPVIYAAMVSVATMVWWVGITTLPTIGLLTIGYGEKSPLRHVFGDAWARFVWMALACLGFSLGPILTGHLLWWLVFPYAIGAGTLGITLRNIPEVVGDLLFGAWFGSILIFIH